MNCKVKLVIGETLQQLLKEKRMSVRELSRISEVPATTISEWLTNRTPRNPVQIVAVANALGISMHVLLFGREDRSEPLQKLLKEDFFSGTFEISIKRVRSIKEDL